MRAHRSSLILLAVAALVVGCSDPAERLAQHLETGRAALEAGELASAEIEFKSALRVDPNDPSAHFGLARTYIGRSRPGEALWELREALRVDPALRDARIAVLRLLRYTSREDREALLEHALARCADEESDWTAWLLRAATLDALDRDDEAAEAFLQAEKHGGHEPLVLFRHASFLAEQGDRAGAEAAYLRLREAAPGMESEQAYARFLAVARARDADAETAYRSALGLAAPEQRGQLVAELARFLFARDRFEESRTLLLAEIEQQPEELGLRFLLASFRAARGEIDRADELLVAAAEAQPDAVQPRLLLAQLRARAGNPEGALAAVDEALALDPDSTAARLARASLLLDSGTDEARTQRIAEGRSVVDGVLAREPTNADALELLARIQLRKAEVGPALDTLRRALDANPQRGDLHLLMGQALVRQGDGPAAEAAFQRALELDPSQVEALQALARLQVDLGESDRAVETGRRALTQAPSDDRLRILVGQELARQGRLDEAGDELAQIPRARRTAEAWYALGQLHSLRGDLAASREALERSLELEPAQPESLAALLAIDRHENRLDESADRIAAALEREPEKGALLRLAGDVALLRGDVATAEMAMRRAAEVDPNDLAAYEGLARVMAQSGRPEEVLATYEAALRARPEDGRLNLLVGSLYEVRGLRRDAMERYEAALRYAPDLALASNNLAWLLVETGGDLDRALDLAQEAKAALPDEPAISDTLGWVLLKKEIPSAAVGYLREAEAGFGPGHPLLGAVRTRLALAYAANGEPGEALEVAERALAGVDDTADSQPDWVRELRELQTRLEAEAGTPDQG